MKNKLKKYIRLGLSLLSVSQCLCGKSFREYSKTEVTASDDEKLANRMLAYKAGDPELADRIDYDGEKGILPAHWAAIWNRRQILEHLIAIGVPLGQKSNSGYTELDYAYIYGHEETATFLMYVHNQKFGDWLTLPNFTANFSSGNYRANRAHLYFHVATRIGVPQAIVFSKLMRVLKEGEYAPAFYSEIIQAFYGSHFDMRKTDGSGDTILHGLAINISKTNNCRFTRAIEVVLEHDCSLVNTKNRQGKLASDLLAQSKVNEVPRNSGNIEHDLQTSFAALAQLNQEKECLALFRGIVNGKPCKQS